MLAFTGFAFLYLAALNGILPFNLGTCTQGSADGLLGGIISLALYLLGALCLVIARPVRWTYVAIVPPLPLFAWQLQFTVRLTYGYLFQAQSACQVMHDLPYEFDGREPFFIGLWWAMCLVAMVGVAIAAYRGRPAD